MSLTHISLFTGIGGIDLAAEAAGFQTIAQAERDKYCRRVLEKHWPDVPRFGDVRDVTADALRDAGIGRPLLLSGGFPCQPFSCAGKRRGREDDRFLWPEMCRIVSELRPAWVLGENVAGFVGMALDDCAADLERLDYAVRAFVVPAAGVGAPHQRARCFIVAHAEHGPLGGYAARCGDKADVGDSDHERRPECNAPGVAATPGFSHRRLDEGGRGWGPEPGICRVAHGVPNRTHRLRSLGNAVVPAQVYPFVKAIAEIETAAPVAGTAGHSYT